MGLGGQTERKSELTSEQELLWRIQRGDKNAFRQLYEQHFRLVYRFILLRVRQPQDAEDLTSETFVRAWRAISSFEWRETSLAAWLLRIAYNLIVDKSRRKRELLAWLPWRHGQDDRAFARVEQRDEISGAFARLSAEQQIILYLRFFEGYEMSDIAKFLGKSPNTVNVAQFRALQQLRKFMGEEYQANEATIGHAAPKPKVG